MSSEEFSDEDIANEINWSMLRHAVLNLSEIVWTYYKALIATGFNEQSALKLTIAWQQEWMRQSAE